MSELEALSVVMQRDWERRIAHDYRFWTARDCHSDEALWRTGERDLAALLQDLPDCRAQTLLEIGCGVGRLLRPARARFARVVGVDIAAAALDRARALVAAPVELLLGNGVDLRGVPEGTIDVAISFAALSQMPTAVIAAYILELHRVLKSSGTVRAQMFIGEPEPTEQRNTFAPRYFEEERFASALEAAGFALEWTRPLTPGGNVIVSFRRNGIPRCTAAELSMILLPQGEAETAIVASDHRMDDPQVEQRIAMRYAERLSAGADAERAARTLEYASAVTHVAAIDTGDVLARIATAVDRRHAAPACLPQNLAVIEKRTGFTSVRAPSGSAAIEVVPTPEGAVITSQGQCLDHPQKPLAAAKSWAAKLLQEPRIQQCKHIIVYGFGGGYHIEALLDQTDKLVSVIEPDEHVFRRAIEQRELGVCLSRLHALSVGEQATHPFLDRDGELVVRPQTQAVHGAYCSKVRAAFYGTRGLSVLHPSIAVLGPFVGGTLPITHYTARGLFELGQRTRMLDMSGFASALPEFEKFVREKTRQDTLRGMYIETVSQVLLELVNEKPLDILICMAQAPISGRVLTELRNKGVITVLWFMEDHLRFTYWKDVARYYDFVFTIQRGECIDKIKAAGAGEVHYLPMACDPLVHRPLQLSADEKARWGSPVSFVGAGYHNRQQMFATLAELPFKIWGTEWPTCRPFDRMVQEEGRRLTPEEYVKIFNATDININLHSSSERDGVDPYGDFVNPRTFELAACGAFQLVDERSYLAELFEPGKEVITFSTREEMRSLIRHYSDRPDERREVAERARRRALSEHTYAQRLQQMLSVIYSSRFEQLKRRHDSSPWKRMLDRAAPHPELLARCEAAHRRGEEPILDGLIADVVTGNGKLSETEQKLLFLFHVRKQIIRMTEEQAGK